MCLDLKKIKRSLKLLKIGLVGKIRLFRQLSCASPLLPESRTAMHAQKLSVCLFLKWHKSVSEHF